MAAEFGRSLLGASAAYVVDVYGSREEPDPAVTGELVVDAARRSGHRRVSYHPDWTEMSAVLDREIRPGDVILTMGAGDIYRLSHQLAGGGS
jgi:UDP-N-acetylmuramate--alanine ligase